MHKIEQMMYFGEAPWHHLGIELKEVPTSEKAIVAAGLNWEVTKEPLFTTNKILLKDHYGIKRSDKDDHKSILGVVGKKYTPVQNINAFSFFDTIVSSKKAIYHTAGSLDKGKVIWILAKLPEGLSISSNDNVELYTLLMNRHDGKRSLIVQPTPIRVVCNNTLNMALSESKNRLTFRHTTRVNEQMRMAALSLAHSLETFKTTKEVYQTISKVEVNTNSLSNYFDRILEIEDIKKAKKSQISKKNRLTEIFEFDRSQNNLKPTYWIAYNAVTYFVDHEMGRTEDKRLLNSWLGDGMALKKEALDTALSMAA